MGADGSQLGIVDTMQALRLARESALDLVEVAATARPPVCRIMDFGKFMYEQKRKEKEAKKNQASSALKECKFHSNVAEHDFETKVNHIKGFFDKGHKVKASLYFRGRENAHRELGMQVMERVIKAVADVCIVDQAPRLIGNQIVMILGPKSKR